MKTSTRRIVSFAMLLSIASGQEATVSLAPSLVPSRRPSETPSVAPSPSIIPSRGPSSVPATSVAPSSSIAPSTIPTLSITSGRGPSESPTVESFAPSTAVPLSAPPTMLGSTSPTGTPSLPPSLFGGPSSTPSIPASAVPSTAPSQSFAPSTRGASNSPTLKCVNDPAFIGVGPDDNGNPTDCSWFEVYNSCQIFGDRSDSKGNTGNNACCICVGGLFPFMPSTQPSSGPSTSQPSEEPSMGPSAAPCGCESCTTAIWNTRTTGSTVTCGERIAFLQTWEGGSLSESDACYQVAHDEFFLECAPCDPLHCSFRCNCESCTDDVWSKTDADGATCGERIGFLQSQGLGAMEACQQIAQSEYPNECGACNPSSSCDASGAAGIQTKTTGPAIGSLVACLLFILL